MLELTKRLEKAYSEYDPAMDKSKESVEKELEVYKKNSNNDFSLFFEKADKYTLHYLLFASKFLLNLNLEHYVPATDKSVGMLYEFCTEVDNLNFEDNEKNLEMQKMILTNYPNIGNEITPNKLKELISRDGESLFKNNSKVLFFEYLIEIYGKNLSKPNTKNDIETFNIFVGFVFKLSSKLRDEAIKIIEMTRIHERERILADLSHRIKNVIYTVEGDLEFIDDTGNKVLVDNVKKGISIIREIIEGFNYSGIGIVEDFIYDASDKEGELITDIVFKSFLSSLKNMFSRKFFNNFMENYFQDRDVFFKAKEEINHLTEIKELEEYCAKWFFYCKIDIKDIRRKTIGKVRGSNVKFRILIQEIILNAVKYSSFMIKEDRDINFKIIVDEKRITISIKNKFDKQRKEKGTGLGLHIVKSMSKIMCGNMEIDKTDDLFLISIITPNYWNNCVSLL